MDLPIKPMLATSSSTLPTGSTMMYEPKWDGFRAIVRINGPAMTIWSRNGKDLTDYFPELAAPIRHSFPTHIILDGEIVVVVRGALDFDALSMRIHPAKSRIASLAKHMAATFVAFDVVGIAGSDIRTMPFADRRRLLERSTSPRPPSVLLTPMTRDPQRATEWFDTFEGAGFDGVIAKPGDEPYCSGERTMFKLKHQRTTDVVVGGYRLHKDRSGIGSLLLGLYDSSQQLHFVGSASGFTATFRTELLELLRPEQVAIDPHPWARWDAQDNDGSGPIRLPGVRNRWSGTKDQTFIPLDCTRIAEVRFSGVTANRLRHVAGFVRWRSDRSPYDSTLEQLNVATPHELTTLLSRT